MCGFKHVTNEHLCSNIKCQWLWRIWRLLGIERCCVMPLFEDVVVDFEFVDLSHLEIMCIYNIWYWLHWMWLWDVLFYMCGKCYFAKCCCPKVKMVKHGRIMHNYALCHLPNVDGQFLVIYLFFLWLSLLAYDVCCDGNFQGQTLCWFEVEVLMDGIWDFYTSIERNIGQNMVFP